MRRPAAQSTFAKQRQPVRTVPREAKTATFPAPVGGWIKNQNLSTPGARLPNGQKVSGAYVLENFFPTATGIRMRGGSQRYATLGDGNLPVTSIFTYANGNNEKLFATTESALYDISTIVDADFSELIDDADEVLVDDTGLILITDSSASTPAVASLTGGDWMAVQFATPGGVFLRAVNGMDTPLAYDGTSWGILPAITGPDPTTLSYAWIHQRRMFFVKKDSLSAFYLAADAIGGAATEIPLGGVFPRGGSLLFGSAWSIESGNGLVEQCVFVSTEGEAAIYQGTDPASASTWSKVGVYRIGRPLGARAHFRAGGDLVIATDIGLVPLSQAISRDVSALSPAAVSYSIETAWNEATAQRSGNWQCEVWPTQQMVLVALPTSDGQQAQMFVANARTGAWGLYTGWDGRCVVLFRDRLFFGSTGGRVIEAEVTGADEGAPYTAALVPLHETFKAPASLKTSLLMRATVRAPVEVLPRLSLQKEYSVSLPAAPDAIAASSTAVWGSGIWGESVWGGAALKKIYQQWQSVGGDGYAIAPGVQITSGSISPPDVELVSVDMTYDQGDIVT